MNALTIPDPAQTFVSPSSNWHNGVHYSSVEPEPKKEGSVSSTLFHQPTNYLTETQQHLQEQLTDFGVCVLFRLWEVAPDVVAKATAVSDERYQNPTACAQAHKSSVPSVQRESESEKDVSKTLNGCMNLELPSLAAENVAEPSKNASVSGSNKCYSPAEFVPKRKDSASTPAVDAMPLEYLGLLVLEDTAPTSHHLHRFPPDSFPRSFHKAWRRDTTTLSSSIPKEIIVKGLSDRINHYSLLIVGPRAFLPVWLVYIQYPAALTVSICSTPCAFLLIFQQTGQSEPIRRGKRLSVPVSNMEWKRFKESGRAQFKLGPAGRFSSVTYFEFRNSLK
ncbi:unnamed protein product [Calicophoron daubneyi]|uniref:Uncharacterized protein n=1 Tax=Calicophoron daubneyi TaxID=300641 RepID=A0AAV2T4R1_CALDB